MSTSYSQSNYSETGHKGALPVGETTQKLFSVQKQHLSVDRPRKLTVARPWELKTDPNCGYEFMLHFGANECSKRGKEELLQMLERSKGFVSHPPTGLEKADHQIQSHLNLHKIQ